MINYIYPPRPEKKVPRSGLQLFDNQIFLAQPKFNGACTEVYLGGENSFDVMNRHQSVLTGFKIPKTEIRNLIHNNNLNIIVGEYMNTSKLDHNNKIFNNKLVIFDIIVLNGKHLLGSTFQQRVDILYDMLSFIDENDYSYRITDNIYMTKTFHGDFCELWDKFTKIDMLEGLVMKRKNAGLESGIGREKNNAGNMVKCRKATKNYPY